ncbi:DUF4397 domain-containing protein [Pedobacter puniceum]|uniref:DUF4397 domain-containing protein n=1 Tax=Pedobacter puniceum TaxID=2666136 RepID=A0A7K0FLT7_9SPHI|nr:DUF4397 domain-containing protein [Pedobacter puniceum]MRX46929.1 DUF4397 domain-containing protein [Pedobacter puniceum]
MKKFIKVAFAIVLFSFTLYSCKKAEEGYVGDYPDKAKLIFVNAAANGSPIPQQARREIAIAPIYNGINFNLFPIKYPWSNGYKVFDPGTLSLRLDTAFQPGNDPAGPSAPVGTYNLNLEADSYYSIYAVGTTHNVDTFFVKDNIDFPTPGKTKILFLNLSPDAGPIDIVNNATGAIMVSNMTYKQRRAYIEVDPGTYSMRMNVAGTTTQIRNVKTGMIISPNSVYTVFVTGLRTAPSPGNTPASQLIQINYHANRWTP